MNLSQYLSLVPGTSNRLDIGLLSKSEIETLGLVNVVEVKGPTELMPGGYFSGNVERVTEYEKAPPYPLVQKGYFSPFIFLHSFFS